MQWSAISFNRSMHWVPLDLSVPLDKKFMGYWIEIKHLFVIPKHCNERFVTVLTTTVIWVQYNTVYPLAGIVLKISIDTWGCFAWPLWCYPLMPYIAKAIGITQVIHSQIKHAFIIENWLHALWCRQCLLEIEACCCKLRVTFCFFYHMIWIKELNLFHFCEYHNHSAWQFIYTEQKSHWSFLGRWKEIWKCVSNIRCYDQILTGTVLFSW